MDLGVFYCSIIYYKMTTKKTKKNENIFSCEKCNFISCKKTDYNRHLLTAKHKILQNTTEKTKKNEKFDSRLYYCDCGKEYKHHSSLWNHKKKCNFTNAKIIDISYQNNYDLEKSNITKETILNLVNENNDIKTLLIEQQKQIVEQQKQIGELIPKIGTTINNTSNVKQNLNFNIFLNEKCKDAINMEDFINQIQLTMDNLEVTKNKGLIEGISNIFIENMNKLSIYERPLHCTDVKRETLYIKDNDNWEKDDDKTKIKAAIKNINKNHYNLIQEWVNENPDYNEIEEKQDYFVQLLRTCGANLESLNDKVIKKVCASTNLKNKIKNLNEKLIE